MTGKRGVRAVLFDVGETLWHFPDPPPEHEIRAASARRVAAVLSDLDGGRGVDAAVFQRHLEEAAVAVHAEDLDYHSPDYVGLVRALLGEYGVEATRDDARRVWEAWWVPADVVGRRWFPDAAETLRWLKGRGYRLACVTNRPLGGDCFLADMADQGVVELFDAWAVSCDLGYEKPHPRIFRHALDELGVAPDEAAMVGDDLRADVEGAQRLGMLGIWKPSPWATERDRALVSQGAVRPDFVVERLADLRRLPVFRNITPEWNGSPPRGEVTG